MTNDDYICDCLKLYLLHVDDTFNRVECSASGNYPSIGIGKWSGMFYERVLELMNSDTDKFVDISFSSMTDEDINELKSILSSNIGINTQLELIKSELSEYLILIDKYIMDDECTKFILVCGYSNFVYALSCARTMKDDINIDSLYRYAVKNRVVYFPDTKKETLDKIYSVCKG